MSCVICGKNMKAFIFCWENIKTGCILMSRKKNLSCITFLCFLRLDIPFSSLTQEQLQAGCKAGFTILGHQILISLMATNWLKPALLKTPLAAQQKRHSMVGRDFITELWEGRTLSLTVCYSYVFVTQRRHFNLQIDKIWNLLRLI